MTHHRERPSRVRLGRVLIMVVALAGSLIAITGTPAAATAPTYEVINFNSALCMDVAGGGGSDNTPIDQWNCLHQTNQLWQVVQDTHGDGYFLLIDVNANKCLDVAGHSTSDGASVIQWHCTSAPNQEWSLTGAPAGGFPVPGNHQYHFVNRYSGKCLDVDQDSTSRGAKLVQWTCTTGYDQLWVVAT